MDSNQPIAAPVVGDIKSAVSLLRKALKGAPKADAEWTGALKAKVDGNKAKLAGKMTAETPSGMMNYSNSLGVVRDFMLANPDISLVNEGANALDNTRMIVDMLKPRKRLDSGTWVLWVLVWATALLQLLLPANRLSLLKAIAHSVSPVWNWKPSAVTTCQLPLSS